MTDKDCKYSVIFFDADRTILDFAESERQMLGEVFAEYGLPCDETILAVYRKHNDAQWRLHEDGLASKEQILLQRFVDTFAELDFPMEVCRKVAERYEYKLADGFHVMKGAEETLAKLQGVCDLYLTTNGVARTQYKRMRGSGLDKYFKKLFVSEVIGYSKPQYEFFDACFTQTGEKDKSNVLVVGDSLPSDVRGANVFGVDSCWYNPEGKINDRGVVPTYEIRDLSQIFDVIKK